MSFLYPRTISVWRMPTESGAGAQGYIGQTDGGLAQIYTGIGAAVQQKKDSGSQPAKLPADVSKRVYWEVLTQPGTQALTIKSNDIIKDDLGGRFQVTGAYLTSFNNWQCICERLEA